MSFAQALQTAQTKTAGQLLKSELEEENGFLVYGIELVTADQAIVDIKVDVGSGKILVMEQDKADVGKGDSDEQENADHEDGDHGWQG